MGWLLYIHILVMRGCWSFTMGLRCSPDFISYFRLSSITECGQNTTFRETWQSRTSVLGMSCSISPSTSVHLLEEFVSGVFIAVVLHFVELPFFWCQHGVNLLRRTQESMIKDLRIQHYKHFETTSCYMKSKWLDVKLKQKVGSKVLAD